MQPALQIPASEFRQSSAHVLLSPGSMKI